MLTLAQAERMNLDDLLKAVEYAVEDGDSYAQMKLYEDWNTFVYWEQGRGAAKTVGFMQDWPVVVSMSFTLMNGHLVLFYYGCSQVVSHPMIEAWIKERMPQLFPEGERRRIADPMNFHLVAHALKEG